MRLWRVTVLMALSLIVGIGLGYVRWGREAGELRDALARAPEIVPRPPETGRWTARGVVRIVLPDQAIVFLTHESIPNLLAGATRAFQLETPNLVAGLSPGDAVRFSIEHRGRRLVLVAIERQAPTP